MEWVIIAIADIVDPTRIYTKNYITQMVETCERLVRYSVTIKTNVPAQWGAMGIVLNTQFLRWNIVFFPYQATYKLIRSI